MEARVRVVALLHKPLHFEAPFFRRLARNERLSFTALYMTYAGTLDHSLWNKGYERPVHWGDDVLEGYEHQLVGPAGGDPQRRFTLTGNGLSGALERLRPHVAVNFGWAYPANWRLMAEARRRDIPVLLYSDTDVREPAGRGPRSLRYAVLSAYCRAAAGALYTGTFNRDFYIRHGISPERLWFSPLAVDIDRFEGISSEEARTALGMESEKTYFLFVGRLIERKRVELLIDTVRRLQETGTPAALVVAGSGPLEGVLRDRAGGLEATKWLGFVDQARLPLVYAAADVLVLPSQLEPHGLVVNEAMAAGRPVIVSSGTGVWGPHDVVRDGWNGLVFRSGSLEQLHEACSRMMRPDLRDRLGQHARHHIREFSYDVAEAGWSAACLALAGGGDRLVFDAGLPLSST